MLIESIFTALK